jgi:hypothetical protein
VRFWTEEEARRYLPRLRQLVRVVRQATERAIEVRGNGHGPAVGDGEEGLPSLDEALAELADGSIVLRDPSTGLVDFPAQGEDGVVYLLCWREDDGDLGWWHLPDEGFAGRRRLPRPNGPAGQADPDR